MGSSGSVDNTKRYLDDITNKLSKSFNKLASGSRITSASDDAAGLAIADALKSDAVVYDQASRNIGDGQSLTQIQDGVFSSLNDIGGRLQELATQSGNGTLSDSQRGALNQEFQQLSQEANRIVGSTEFNGQNVFSGQSTAIQVGKDSSSDSQINISDSGVAGTVASLVPLSIDTQQNAQSAIDSISSFTKNISASQGNLGAQQSRLDVANSNAQTISDNSRAAESRIRDLDVADEVARKTALSIQQQSAVALSAQAGKLNAAVISKLLS